MGISKTQSEFLNFTRWIAAAFVVLEHSRSLLFKDYGLIEFPGVIEKAFYFATGFGHEAVVIFFVTSGYLVGGKTCDLVNQDRFQWRRYLADRTSRLYAVLAAALVIGGLLDWTGSLYFNSFGFYTNQTPENVAVIGGDFTQRISISHFAISLLMLQEVWLPSFGSNGPLWSLAHEWWYYLLFPTLLGCLRGSLFGRLACVLLFSVFYSLLTSYILILFGVWLLGVVGWKMNGRRWMSPLLSLPLFLLALLLMRLEIQLFPYANQYFLGIGFVLLLNSFAQCQRDWLFGRTSRWLADFSYSLYLMHLPVILFATSVLFTLSGRSTRYELSMSSAVLFAAVILIAYLVSFALSLITESKTRQIRDWLYSVIGVGPRQTIGTPCAIPD